MSGAVYCRQLPGYGWPGISGGLVSLISARNTPKPLHCCCSIVATKRATSPVVRTSTVSTTNCPCPVEQTYGGPLIRRSGRAGSKRPPRCTSLGAAASLWVRQTRAPIDCRVARTPRTLRSHHTRLRTTPYRQCTGPLRRNRGRRSIWRRTRTRLVRYSIQRAWIASRCRLSMP